MKNCGVDEANTEIPSDSPLNRTAVCSERSGCGGAAVARGRPSLPVEKQVDYDHPSTVRRRWNAWFGFSAAVDKGPTRVE
jgi:hypothetical protein